MILTELTTKNFRLLGNSTIRFEPGLNIIAGQNATGKTSVLEAIGFCLRGRSIIGAIDEEIPTFGTSNFFAGIHCLDSNRSKIEITFDGKKSVKADGKPIRSSKELIDLFKLVVITPASTAIATGAPSQRRDFLDDTASQINSIWASVVNEYRAIIKDRNALLKKEFSRNLLEVLNTQLVKLGKNLREIRQEIIKNFNLLSDPKHIKIDLIEHDQLSQQDISKYANAEKARGITLIGPHRDDCSFLLHGKKVERFASTGEARSVILTLKTAQADLIKNVSSIEPIILADDLLAELDKNRAKEAQQNLCRYTQVLLTCAGDFPHSECNIIEANSWKK